MQDGQDATRWERLKELFAEALEAEGDARAQVLAGAAREDEALGRELSALLEAHERGGLMAAPTLPPEAWGAAPAPGARPAPARIGRYEVRSLLGAGGMGEVWLAHDTLLDRDVALKLLPAGLARRPQRRARLLREARAAASLNHPNITVIHEVGQADGRDYIAFEHLTGRTLRARVADGPLPPRELLDVAAPLADALAAAHERGLLHRDVKAANVMVSDRGVPKLLDFGLASPARAEPGEEPDDDLRSGTPAAMSPEQARGAALDARTDIFSLGSLLHELATGKPPFEGRDVAQTLDAVQHRAAAPLRGLRPDLPRDLSALVARMLDKDPARRPQRMADVAAELRRLQQRAAAAPARRALVAALALAAAVTGVLLATRDGAGPAAPPPPELLAVMGFENSSDPRDAEELGGMLARLLGAHLAAGEGPDVLSPQRLHDVARQAGAPDGRVGRDLASEVARRAGVTTMVLGRIEAVPDGLLASAEVVDVASGRTLLAPRARGAGPPDLFNMAESLGRQVREGLREPAMTADERAALAGQLTTSLEAFRAYVRGLEALLRNNPHEASAALSEATRLDPAFALAHLRLGLACIWTGDGQRGEAAFERALAFRDRLPPELQRLVDVLRPYYSSNDDTRTALPLLLAALESEPHEHDVLYMLGEIYTHSATRADPARAAEMFLRLLALDPGLSLVYEHLLTALLRGGRRQEAHAQLEAWRALQPANLAELEGTLALWEGRLDEAARGLRDPLIPEFLAGRTDAPALRAVLAADLAGQREAAAALQGVYRILALDLRAGVLAAHGRFEDAASLYAQAAAEHDFVSVDSFMSSVRNVARQHHAQLLAATGDLDGARALAEHVRAEQPDTFRAPWFAARLALQAGDDGHARAQLALLEDLASRGWGPSATLYRDALAAELLLHDGRAAQARAAFTALVGSGRLMEDWYTCEDSPGPLLREGLARACLADGDAAAAAAALDGLIGAGFERLRQPVPWVLAHFEHGRLLLSQGHDVEGRALLERFLAHWGAADRELPEVAAARALLGR